MTNRAISFVDSTGDAGDHYVGLDRFGRIESQLWTDGTNDLDHYTYTYDRNSNRTAKANVLNGDLDEVYSYDNLNRLTANVRDGQAHESWELDALGNWQAVTTDGMPEERTHNAQNQITTLAYDDNGNTLTDQDGRQFTYDAWNRLAAGYDSEEVLLETFAYDGAWRRISVAVNGGVTTDYYLSDNWQVLEDRIDGAVTASYVWSPVYVDAMVARDRDTDANGSLDERQYPTHDANYNVTSLTGTDGQTKERYADNAYGKHMVFTAVWGTLADSAYDWQYIHQGGRYDKTLLLYYFRHRDYSPESGRWMQQDPLGYVDGGSLYEYVHGDPTSYLDPRGTYRLLGLDEQGNPLRGYPGGPSDLPDLIPDWKGLSPVPAPWVHEGWGLPGTGNFPGPGYADMAGTRPTSEWDFVAKLHDFNYAVNDLQFGHAGDWKDRSRKSKADYIFRRLAKAVRGSLNGPQNFWNSLSKLVFEGRSTKEFYKCDDFSNVLDGTEHPELGTPDYLMIPYNHLQQKPEKVNWLFGVIKLTTPDYNITVPDDRRDWRVWAQGTFGATWNEVAKISSQTGKKHTGF